MRSGISFEPHSRPGDYEHRGQGYLQEVGDRGLLRQFVRGRSRRGLLRQGPKAPSDPRVGNREANRALYMVCLARMRGDQRPQEYVTWRTREGKGKREIIRCLQSATSPGKSTAL